MHFSTIMELLMQDLNESSTSTVREAQQSVLDYIESTFTMIVEEIQHRPCGQPCIILKRLTKARSQQNYSKGIQLDGKELKISFPGKNKAEACRFACVGKILYEVYTALKTGRIVTKRDIYYSDPELFRNQIFVDQHVDMLAFTCGVTRFDLNVTASPKGLIAGLSDMDDPYELVPDKSPHDLRALMMSKSLSSDWKWILVIEKEATFKSLIESKVWLGNDTIGRGILITGKGYPDLATKRILRACADHQLSRSLHLRAHPPTILGLFDCDPDGIKIFDVYRHGSSNLAHERAYNVPEMRWIGLRPDDFLTSGSEESITSPLSSRDCSKIKSMLLADAESMLGTGLGSEPRAALQGMRMLNRKGEIQVLARMSGGMMQWLMSRMEEAKADAKI